MDFQIETDVDDLFSIKLFLQPIVENERLSSSRGFGVHNVRNRINLYFGKGYGIHFSSSEGQGTLVSVRVPALLEDELASIVKS